MDIKFFDDPFEGPKPREEVRIKQLGLYMHEDGRRVAVGFDITPFLERPSIQVTFTNERGEEAGSLVPLLRHRAGRGRGRIRRPHLAVDLRQVPVRR